MKKFIIAAALIAFASAAQACDRSSRSVSRSKTVVQTKLVPQVTFTPVTTVKTVGNVRTATTGVVGRIVAAPVVVVKSVVPCPNCR